uniref:Riboflavin synthase n=1 Tax=Skeletonema marinoi TaxID=267567 RepID=A0A7S2KV65_9STRA
MVSFILGTTFLLLSSLLPHDSHGFAPSPSTRHVVGGHSSSIPTSSSQSKLTTHHMFTGIIEEMGEVISLETRDDMTLWDGSKGKGTEMVLKGDIVLDGAYLGCSISVNGVCLTATEIDEDAKTFKVGLAPETLRKTNLGTYVPESQQRVNMERASEIGGRNSGHFVQGHVDNVGTIMDQWIDENSLFFKIAFPYEFMRYVVPKGFIAIDGTSLTVCDVHSEGEDGENWFTFMLVEYTQTKIILPSKKVGDTVNVEVDVLGKYSEQAWEAFVPKMEALETKVKQLEARLQELEGGESTTSSSATDNDVNYGQPIGGLSNVAAAATAPTPEQVKVKNTDGTEWVRTKQSFFDTQY